MIFYLTPQAVLKSLETPFIYHIAKDELYELDNDSFRFFRECATSGGCTTKDSAFVDYCLEEGLLTTEKVSSMRPLVAKSPDPSLRYLELQVTSMCNLRCKHCYIDAGQRVEMPVERIRRVLSEFEDLQGLRVLITGGEPLLHTRFDEINEMLPEFFLRKILFTNGVLLTDDIIKKLKVNEIQVSVDGLESAHDALRGNGMFAQSLEAVRQALDAGFEVSVSTMVHRGNFADFDEMEHLFKTMGIKDWAVDIPCPTGRVRNNPDIMVSPKEGGKYLGYGYGGGMHTTGHGYACGLHLMSATSDGKASKCTFYADRPVGTVDEGLRACWQRIRPIRMETLRCDCDFLEACRGGCRYRAELSGSALGKDPYRCSLYGIIDSGDS